MASMSLGRLSVVITADITTFMKQVDMMKNYLNTQLADWKGMAPIIPAQQMKQNEASFSAIGTSSDKLNHTLISNAKGQTKVVTKQMNKMAQGGIASMINLQSFVAKIVHYITFSIGVQMVMGIRRGFEMLFASIKEFESSTINAATVAGYLSASFDSVVEHLQNLSRELGKTTLFSINEVAKALYSLASAGFDVAEMTEEDLIPLINYATATQTELDFALQSVTKTMKQFKLEFEDATTIVDAFTTTITSTYATAEKLAEGMKYVGAIAGVLGQDVDTVSASLGILYSRGLESGQAGQRLNMIFTKLLKPTEKAKKMLDGLGVSLESLNPRTHDLVEILYTLQAANFGAAEAASMFRARTAGTGVMLVEAADEVADLTAKIRMSGGITEQVANKQMVSLQNQLKLLTNRTEEAAIDFKDVLIPALTYGADIVEKNVIPALRMMASVFGGMIVLLRPFKGVISALVPVLMSVGVALVGLFISGKLFTHFLTEATLKSVAAATGFKTLGMAIKSTTASAFMIAAPLILIAEYAGPLKNILYGIAIALIALTFAHKIFNAETIISIKQQLLLAVTSGTLGSALLAEQASIWGLIGAYAKLRIIQLKDIVVKSWQAVASALLAVKNKLLGVSIAGLIAGYSGLVSWMAAKIGVDIVSTTTTGALTVAQWAWNIALYACPIFLIIGGIAALIMYGGDLLKLLSNWWEGTEALVVITDELKSGLNDYNDAMIHNMDISKEIESTYGELQESEKELIRLREEGKEATEEYTIALEKFNTTYIKYNELLQESGESNKSFIEAGASVVYYLRSISEGMDKAMAATYSLLTAEMDESRNNEKYLNTQSRRVNLMNEYSNTVARYGAESEQAVGIRDELASVENDYWEITKDLDRSISERLRLEVERQQAVNGLNVVERQQYEIGEKMLRLNREVFELDNQRMKLMAKRNVLQQSLTEQSKLYEEKLKGVWEMQLKVYEAELALYKIQKEKPEILDELFNKMAEYGLLTEDIILAYKDLKEAEADLFVARMEYFDVMKNLTEEERQSVGDVITEYQRLLEEGMDPLTAWAKAQENLGVDLSAMGIPAGAISTIWNYADAEWEVVRASKAMENILTPVLETLGSLDFGDLPSDLKEIFTLLETWLGREQNAVDKLDDTTEELTGSWKGFADVASYVWRALQDTPFEALITTFAEMIDESDTLKSIFGDLIDDETGEMVEDLGGAFNALKTLFPDTEATNLIDLLEEIGEEGIVSAFGMLEFANSLGIPLGDITTIDGLMGSISRKLSDDISIGFSEVSGYVDTMLGDVDSLYIVLSSLNDTLFDLNITMHGLKVTTEAVAAGGYDKWKKNIRSIYQEWVEVSGLLEDGQTFQDFLQTEDAEGSVGKFIKWLFETMPADFATKYSLDFADAYSGMAGFEGNVDSLMVWLNEQEWTFAMHEVISSGQFKENWIGNLGEMKTWLDDNQFPVELLSTLDGFEWTNITGWADNTETTIQSAIDAAENPVYTIDVKWNIEEPPTWWDKTWPKIADFFLGKQPVLPEDYEDQFFKFRQKGIMETRGPQQAVIGEAGAEAVVPLEGSNKKYGERILQYILPKYFGMGMQAGGVVGGYGNTASLFESAFSESALEKNADAIEELTKLLGKSDISFESISKLVPLAAQKFSEQIDGSSEGLKFASDWVIQNEKRFALERINLEKIGTANWAKQVDDAGGFFYNDIIMTTSNVVDSFSGISDDFDSSISTWSIAIERSAKNWYDAMGITAKSWYDAIGITAVNWDTSMKITAKGMSDILLSSLGSSNNGGGDNNEGNTGGGGGDNGSGDTGLDDWEGTPDKTIKSTRVEWNKLAERWLGWVKSTSGVSKKVATDPKKENVSNFLKKNYPIGKSISFAEGGIVNKPTFGMFGEAGAEALIPLEKNKGMGTKILESIIPSYYPELMQQTGGIFNDINTSNISHGEGNTSNVEEYNIMGPINVTGVNNATEFMESLKARARATGARR